MKKWLSLFLTLSIMISCVSGAFAAAAASPMDEAELLENIEAMDAYGVQNTGSEFGYASKTSSADLAWNASYQLESYYNMYRATEDAKYLKKLGDCFEYALRSRTDNNDNNVLGWDCSNYSIAKITDPGFNSELSENTDWSFSENGAKIVTEGESERRLELAAGASMTLEIPEYAPDKIYELKADIKSGTAEVVVTNETTGEVINNLQGQAAAALPIDYKGATDNAIRKESEQSLRYKFPAAGNKISVSIRNNTKLPVVLDNVKFAQVAQFLLHQMLMCAPAARFVEAVYQDATLGALAYDSKRTYRQVAEEFLGVIEPMVNQWEPDWKNIGNDRGIYYWPSDESGEAGFVLPHNHYSSMVRTMLPLYAATKNEKYLDHATRMLTFFKSNIRTIEKNGRKFYTWNYMDRAFDTEEHKHDYTEDTSHAALNLNMIFTGMEYGIAFSTVEDIPYLLNTVYETLWNGSMTNPEIYGAIEYDGGAGCHVPIASENVFRDWIYMGRWDRNIVDAFTTYFNQNGNDPKVGHVSKLLAYTYAYRALHGDNLKFPVNFKDMGNYAWASAEVKTLAENGVLNGTGNGNYSPANNVKRADMTVMLMRAFDIQAEPGEAFGDVSANAYYADAVLRARAAGIVNGADNRFNPNAAITREDLMVILNRALTKVGATVPADQKTSFSDWNAVSSYAKASVENMTRAGIVNGANGKINPKGCATRAEVAVMLYRALSLIKK